MPDFQKLLSDHQRVMAGLETLQPRILEASKCLQSALKSDKKVMLCGNGGSAADAQHIAAEIVGRFEAERRGLPAIALTTDTSILTAVGNDYGYKSIFSRQVQALSQPGDVLIAYSTSGNSENVLEAAEKALESGCAVISMTGNGGGALGQMAKIDLCVGSTNTARIQEAHAFIGHVLCAAIDEMV